MIITIGLLEDEKALEVAAAHVAELSRDKLPDGMDALGADVDDVFKKVIR